MARVVMKPRKAVNKKVARLPGVRRAVDKAAMDIQAKAEANLGKHRYTGNTRIEVDASGVDAVVALVSDDPRLGGANPAMSIEFGHIDAATKKPVEGTHALMRAAGIL